MILRYRSILKLVNLNRSLVNEYYNFPLNLKNLLYRGVNIIGNLMGEAVNVFLLVFFLCIG